MTNEILVAIEIYHAANPEARVRKELPIAALAGDGRLRPVTCGAIVDYLLSAQPDQRNQIPYTTQEQWTAITLEWTIERMKSTPNERDFLVARTATGRCYELDLKTEFYQYLTAIPILHYRPPEGKPKPSLKLELVVGQKHTQVNNTEA